jgi:galactokinase
LADGEYGRRRADCERATAILGLHWLRDLTIDQLPDALARLDSDTDPRADVLRRRVRHVVTENDRVEQTVRLLRAGAVADIGELLTGSHRSLRDDYEVSCPELDLAVESALAAGALGARMTGGGFGGSVIALLPAQQVAAAIARVSSDFAASNFTEPVARIVGPAQGARRDS